MTALVLIASSATSTAASAGVRGRFRRRARPARDLAVLGSLRAVAVLEGPGRAEARDRAVRADPGAVVPARVLGLGPFLPRRQPRPARRAPTARRCASARSAAELVDHAWPTVLLRIKAVAALAVGAGAVRAAARGWRGGQRRLRAPTGDRELAAAGVSVACSASAGGSLIAIMTQAGFSGNDRYLVLGAALIDDRRRRRAGAGRRSSWARPVAAAMRRSRGARDWPGHRSALVRAAVRARLRVGAAWIGKPHRPPGHAPRARLPGAAAQDSAAAAVTKLGGPSKVLACGTRDDRGLPGADARVDSSGSTRRRQASPLTADDAGPRART